MQPLDGQAMALAWLAHPRHLNLIEPPCLVTGLVTALCRLPVPMLSPWLWVMAQLAAIRHHRVHQRVQNCEVCTCCETMKAHQGLAHFQASLVSQYRAHHISDALRLGPAHCTDTVP